MKTAVVIGIGSLVSMLLIAGMFFAMLSANPAAFGVVPQKQASADSLHIEQKDSVITESVTADSLKKESVPAEHPAEIKGAVTDSKTDMKASVKTESKTGLKAAVRSETQKTEAARTIVFEDTTDWKSKAKLFEAMSIESASSILRTMNDHEVKLIIPHIKKRNAAKILATFDPDRAARIIR